MQIDFEVEADVHRFLQALVDLRARSSGCYTYSHRFVPLLDAAVNHSFRTTTPSGRNSLVHTHREEIRPTFLVEQSSVNPKRFQSGIEVVHGLFEVCRSSRAGLTYPLNITSGGNWGVRRAALTDMVNSQLIAALSQLLFSLKLKIAEVA